MKKLIVFFTIFLNFLFIFNIQQGYTKCSDEVCQECGVVTISYDSINYTIDVPQNFTEPITLYLGFTCVGFQTLTMEDTGAVCTFDTAKIGCFVSSNVAWLEPESGSAVCNSAVPFNFDFNKLPIQSASSQTFTAQIKISCSNGFDDAEDTLNITLNVSNLDDYLLSVSPENLLWSSKYQGDNSTYTFDEKTIKISNSLKGWDYECNVQWLTITKGADDSTLTVKPSESFFADVKQGYYQTTITIKDKAFNISKVIPVTVEIRGEGDPLIIPSYYDYDSDASNSFFLESCDAENLYLSFNIGSYFTVLPTSLLSNYKTFILLDFPELNNGLVWSYTATSSAIFQPISYYGVSVANADNLYYAKGELSSIPFGPFIINGLKDKMHIQVKVGETFATSQTVQDINMNIYTLEGDWVITDEYQGTIYQHPETFAIWHSGQSLIGCMYQNGVCFNGLDVDYGYGSPDILYQISFTYSGYTFEYLVESINSLKFSGKWRWCKDSYCSSYDHFTAVKNINTFSGK